MSKLIHGDCLDVMSRGTANTFDAVVTDPPYGLKFMGKQWDHGVPGVPFWEQALRVTKPGGILLAFGGTRTFHRLACAIEDAGWEIRDCLSWMYGTGFPKSRNIGKALDKMNGESGRLLKFTRWMRTTGVTAKQINEATGTFMGSHYLTDKTQPAIPTTELWGKLRVLCGDIPTWVDDLVRRIEAEREVIGEQTKGSSPLPGNHDGTWADGQKDGTFQITTPATDEAKIWEGWGTALKPAWEPIILAMKPCDGTFANNALAHGVAGLNIDGCRIGSELLTYVTRGVGGMDKRRYDQGTRPTDYSESKTPEPPITVKGRWPANLVLDEEAGAGEAWKRYFYCAKASKKERGEGNKHATVKPLALMRYLCRLVKTPTGGKILDPFMGSGTTGVAALQEGMEFVGIEQEQEHYETAKRRVEGAVDG